MITLNNVTKHYEACLVKALNGITLSIGRREIVSFTGPSGCGKSTLFNLIGAMDLPSGGEIRFNGKDLREYRPFARFRAKNIGFVFQFHHLIPAMTVLENVEAAMAALSIPRKTRRKRARELLEKMGLSEKLGSFPTRISGGERQRAAIARAIANDPQVVLADEPTGNLDSATGEAVIDFLIGHCRENRATLLIATHNREIAAKTDRIISMRDGRIVNPL